MWNPIRGLIRWWSDQKREQEEIRQRLQQRSEYVRTEILPLSIATARQRAEALLADRTRFRCDKRFREKIEPSRLAVLAPLLREFFERYAFVQPADQAEGSAEEYLTMGIKGEELGLDETDLVPIGLVEGGHAYVAVKPGSETVYEVDDLCDPERGIHSYPSIYHYLLARDRYYE